MRSKKLIPVLFCCFLFLPAIPAVAEIEALQCACTPKSFDVRWNDATAVFIGTVRKITILREMAYPTESDLPAEVTIAVEVPYKGVKKDDAYVAKTSLTRFTCSGYPFQEGGQYLVFARMREAGKPLEAELYNFPSGTNAVNGLCSGTKTIRDPQAVEDVKKIKKILGAPPDGWLPSLFPKL